MKLLGTYSRRDPDVRAILEHDDDRPADPDVAWRDAFDAAAWRAVHRLRGVNADGS